MPLLSRHCCHCCLLSLARAQHAGGLARAQHAGGPIRGRQSWAPGTCTEVMEPFFVVVMRSCRVPRSVASVGW